jgi:peroxiredoxin
VVWGVASEDDYPSILAFTEQLGLDFPVLLDEGGAVMEAYAWQPEFFNSVYPMDRIVGVDGTVVYASSAYEPAEIRAVLDAELARQGR